MLNNAGAHAFLLAASMASAVYAHADNADTANKSNNPMNLASGLPRPSAMSSRVASKSSALPARGIKSPELLIPALFMSTRTYAFCITARFAVVSIVFALVELIGAAFALALLLSIGHERVGQIGAVVAFNNPDHGSRNAET
ncbi:hypothetical protein [Pseudomonas frederiksbergensis]|uniref:hypothetical protein n=1 Tax=Pseudomonas frederiksbergensis TaxID=104087 RepID=UPI0012EBAC8E|nr:hypothetical protein [Pseudomonas frederiksbergensis]